MKKSTKILLFLALGFIILGLALYGAAIGVTGRFSLDVLTFDSREPSAGTRVITESFHSIRITDVQCDIRFLPSEDETVTVAYTDTNRYRHDIRVENDTLIIAAQDTGTFWSRLFRMDLFQEEHTLTIFLPFREVHQVEAASISGGIRIPEEFTLHSLSARTVSGTIALNCQVLNDLDIENTSGTITLENSFPAELSIETVSGEVILTDVTVSEFTELSSVSGNLLLNNFDCPSLNAETVSGTVTGSILSPKHVLTDTTSGSVYISENRSDAPKWEIETVSGDIHITIAP